MAEQIPYAVASSLINRLASEVFHKFGQIYGVMDELKRLKKTIESIKVVLVDAEEKQEQNQVVQYWIRRLKDDVLHPTDDMLDEFALEDMRQNVDESHKKKMKKVLHSFSPNQLAFRLKIAHKIEKIQNKVDDVVKDMAGLNLTPHVVVINQTDCVRRESSSFVLESDIIGRGDDKNEIISLLRQPHRNHSVSCIAIVGIGGLGKTALSQLVYHDVEVKNIFEKKMWVCVSDNFDVKTIVRKILESLMNCEIDGKLSLDNLQNMLRENLTNVKYLLVLDDIWNESHKKWTELRTYLMCGAQDSKILVTTRSKIVAQTMGISTPFVLNGLNAEESWSLLKSIAFWDDTEVVIIQTLEPIGKKITEKCKGVPLAIRTLGGILRGKREESEWVSVLEGEFWQLCKDEDTIMPVLKLSYQKLPPEMRQCFAYCSLYPKDWVINKDELIELWMAQGYLEYSGEKESMEGVGNQFVEIFFMKSFFQDARMTKDGDLYSFKMHDLMHDLAMQVASGDCCYLDSETKKLVGRPMHVWLEPNVVGLLDSLDASRVRTLILRPPYGVGSYDINFSNFKNLRALLLWNSKITNLSNSIGKVNHLRYFAIGHCSMVGNPKFISIPACLQTLRLKSKLGFPLSTEKNSKLINLRQVEINWMDFNSEVPKEMKPAGLRAWLDGTIFSSRLCSVTNIIQISLIRCTGLEYLPPLERLPFLKSLYISQVESLRCIYYEKPLLPGSFFPSLESLTLFICLELSGWVGITKDGVINDDTTLPHFAFPRLSQLEIAGCSELTCIPTFPNIDKIVDLDEDFVRILEPTLTVSDNISLPPLSKLKSLIIRGSGDLKNLPKGWLQNLTSLEHLSFWWLSSQQCREIEIWFKDNLNCLPCLKEINFCHCYDLTTLPE